MTAATWPSTAGATVMHAPPPRGVHVGPEPGDWVWFAATWRVPVIVHDNAYRAERIVTIGDYTGPVAGWAYTRCGILRYDLKWSERDDRFYLGTQQGYEMPLRLLNPARVRPCAKCWR